MSIFATEQVDLDQRRDPTAAELEAVERIKPVEMRLNEALAKIPYAVQCKGVPLALIQRQLRARTRGARVCHAGELTDALFRRGWTRHMHHERRGAGQVVTLYYPPGVDPVKQAVEERPKLKAGRPPKWVTEARRRAKEEGIAL